MRVTVLRSRSYMMFKVYFKSAKKAEMCICMCVYEAPMDLECPLFVGALQSPFSVGASYTHTFTYFSVFATDT